MSKISHQHAKTLIQATMGGSITKPEQENLARHLDTCADCQEYASQMDALEGSLRHSFHTRWDSTRGPSTWVVEAIHKKTRTNLMYKDFLGFARTAIVMGIIVAFAILVISIRSMQSVPLSGGQLNQTQAPTLIPTLTVPISGSMEVLFIPSKVVWVPPSYGQDNPVTASQMIGPGTCVTPSSNFMGTGTFIWPTKLHFISGYDYAPDTPQHRGIDLAGSSGDPVYAADGGVVVFAGWDIWGYGSMVVIDHGNGKQTLYAHLNSVDVSCNEHLMQGSIIGRIGMTGNSYDPHLHFEIFVNNEQVNPHEYLPSP